MNILDEIKAVGVRLVEKQLEVKNLEEQLVNAKAEVETLSLQTLPDLMNSLGITEITLANGTKIKIAPHVVGYISKDDMPRVEAWLEANNASAIMKRKLVVDFDNKERLVESNVPFKSDVSIHHSTLQAFIKEQVGTNQNFPRELFGVQEGFKATTKLP